MVALRLGFAKQSLASRLRVECTHVGKGKRSDREDKKGNQGCFVLIARDLVNLTKNI